MLLYNKLDKIIIFVNCMPKFKSLTCNILEIKYG